MLKILTFILFLPACVFGQYHFHGDMATANLKDVENNGVALGNTSTHFFFTSKLENHGYELWATDGTEHGTELLYDIYNGRGSSEIMRNEVFFHQHQMFFAATDPFIGRALWVTDGTSEGTKLIADIRDDSKELAIDFLDVLDNKLFFADHTNTSNTILYYYSLIDGSINKVSNFSSNGVDDVATAQNLLYFTTDDGTYQTNGEASGTIKIADYDKGHVRKIILFGNRLAIESNNNNLYLFSGRRFQFTTIRKKIMAAGKQGNRVLIGTKDSLIVLNADGKVTSQRIRFSDNATIADEWYILHNYAFASAKDNAYMLQGAKNILTPIAKTKSLVNDVQSWKNGLLVYMVKNRRNGNNEVYFSRGQTSNTKRLFSYDPGLPGIMVFHDTLIFKSVGNDFINFHNTQNNNNVTFDLRRKPTRDANPRVLASNGKKILIHAKTKIHRLDLSNDKLTTLSAIEFTNSGYMSEIVSYKNDYYFIGKTGSYTGLFKVDTGFSKIERMNKPDGDPIQCDTAQPVVFNNKLYFSAGHNKRFEPWSTKGTDKTSQQVGIIYAKRGSWPYYFNVHKGKLYFTASNLSREIMVIDKNDNISNYTPRLSSGQYGYGEDLVGHGTMLILDDEIISHNRSNSGQIDVVYQNGSSIKIASANKYDVEFFHSKNAAGHNILLVRDGQSLYSYNITDNNKLILNYKDYFNISVVYDVVQAGNNVYFVGGNKGHGIELWKTNGLPGGTKRITDFAPDELSAFPRKLFVHGDYLYFSIATSKSGSELYFLSTKTDNPILAAEISPGGVSSFPNPHFIHQDRVFFSAFTQQYGDELYSIDLGACTNRAKLDINYNCKDAYAITGLANNQQLKDYAWTVDTTITQNDTLKIKPANGDTIQLFLQGKDVDGCEVIDSLTLTHTTNKKRSIVSSHAGNCSEDSIIHFSTLVDDAVHEILWHVNGDAYRQNQVIHTIDDTTTLSVHLKVTDVYGCVYQDSLLQTARYAPGAQILSFHDSLCQEDSFKIYNESYNRNNADSFSWFVNGIFSNNGDQIIQQAINPGDNIVHLTRYENGCESSIYDTIKVLIKPDKPTIKGPNQVNAFSSYDYYITNYDRRLTYYWFIENGFNWNNVNDSAQKVEWYYNGVGSIEIMAQHQQNQCYAPMTEYNVNIGIETSTPSDSLKDQIPYAFTNSQSQIQCKNAADRAFNVQVFSVEGKLLESQNIPAQSLIDLKIEPTGLCIVVFTSGDKQYVQKLLLP